MVRYTFWMIYLLGVSTQAHSLYHLDSSNPDSYGISIYEDRPKVVELSGENTNLTIKQNGTIIDTYSTNRFNEIYRGDLNGDGYEELILQGFSGGAHCCFDLGIIQIRPHMPTPYHIATANTEYVTIKDLDQDKIPEIITWDDQYSYGFGFCFACSPWVKVIANFDGSRLVLRPKLMKQHTKPKDLKILGSEVMLSKDGFLSLDSNHAPDIIRMMLYYIYTGEAKKAASLMNLLLLFEHPAVKKLFLIELVKSMRHSPYWDQIRRVNGWKEETGCIGKDCTPPEVLYDADSVVRWFFN